MKNGTVLDDLGDFSSVKKVQLYRPAIFLRIPEPLSLGMPENEPINYFDFSSIFGS